MSDDERTLKELVDDDAEFYNVTAELWAEVYLGDAA